TVAGTICTPVACRVTFTGPATVSPSVGDVIFTFATLRAWAGAAWGNPAAAPSATASPRIHVLTVACLLSVPGPFRAAECGIALHVVPCPAHPSGWELPRRKKLFSAPRCRTA